MIEPGDVMVINFMSGEVLYRKSDNTYAELPPLVDKELVSQLKKISDLNHRIRVLKLMFALSTHYSNAKFRITGSVDEIVTVGFVEREA